MLPRQFQMMTWHTWKRSRVTGLCLRIQLKLHSRQCPMLCQARGMKTQAAGNESHCRSQLQREKGWSKHYPSCSPASRLLLAFLPACVLPGAVKWVSERGFRRAPMSFPYQSMLSPCFPFILSPPSPPLSSRHTFCATSPDSLLPLSSQKQPFFALYYTPRRPQVHNTHIAPVDLGKHNRNF